MKQHTFDTENIRLGKKGQITIPKWIREEDGLKEQDAFKVTHMPSGDIILSRRKNQTPEERMLNAISKAPSFDADAAWKEVVEERKKDR